MRTQMKLARGLVTLALGTFAAAAAAEAPPGPLEPLAWLAGSCWSGTFADGKTKDLVCYEWAFDGMFLRSRHRVTGGPEPYSGETLFSFEKATGTIRFDYYNSLGDVMRSSAVSTADGVSFPVENASYAGAPIELRSAWTRRGADGYSAITERRYGEEWRAILVIEFVRSGPASDWRAEE